MESNLKIDCDFISTWHPKYDQIGNDETEYRNLVALIKKEIGQKSTVSKETFIRILNWKSPRVKGIVIRKTVSGNRNKVLTWLA